MAEKAVPIDQEQLRISHLKLLSLDEVSLSKQRTASNDHELMTAPLFSYPVAALAGSSSTKVFPQHCLLAGILPNEETPAKSSGYVTPAGSSTSADQLSENIASMGLSEPDPRIFLNVNAPWSAFICGSQGSGKSYTMSCMLEACLKVSPELGNALPNPLAGLVFHYDKHVGSAGAACEAAFLCSAGIPVTILVSESSHAKMERLYGAMKLPMGVQPPKVQALKFKEEHINLERMLSMMCVSTEQKKPLYIETITNILRGMASEDPLMIGVKISKFLERLRAEKLKPEQLSPLNLRLAILGSFLEGGLNSVGKKDSKPSVPQYPPSNPNHQNPWELKPGTLTIVDLSCPFVDESSACALFSMCLSLFLESKSTNPLSRAPIGKVVALDEAHKFMTSTPGSETFTSSLISSIRMQRHYGVRVIIATQEPTISPALMDLCSLTLVHRFSSPRWMKELRGHLPGLTLRPRKAREQQNKEGDEDDDDDDTEDEVFSMIGKLETGEALLLCQTALLWVDKDGKVRKLGFGRRRVRIRKRVTDDGGMSVMAS